MNPIAINPIPAALAPLPAIARETARDLVPVAPKLLCITAWQLFAPMGAT